MQTPAEGPTYKIVVRDLQCPRPDGSVMLVRVASPQGDGPFPAIVDIHGGGWVMGDRNQNAVIDDYLAANGIVVAAPEFRMPPTGAYPVSITDVRMTRLSNSLNSLLWRELIVDTGLWLTNTVF